MKRIMISQPLDGIPIEQVTETRNRFLEYAKEEKLEVVNTFFDFDFHSIVESSVLHTSLFYLAKVLEEMSKCHKVYMAKGWAEARGCKIEYEAAREYGLEIIFE